MSRVPIRRTSGLLKYLLIFAMKQFKSNNLVHREILKQRFVDEVKEYQQLNSRRWKRKKELEKSIASLSKYWIEDIEKINDSKKRIVIPKIISCRT